MSFIRGVVRGVVRPVVRGVVTPGVAGGGVSFSPMDLEPAIWIDASRNAYSDAGTTPAVADGAVYRIDDQSGNSRYIEQTTELKRPLLKVVDGRTVFRTDGSNDVIRSTSFNLPQPCTIYAVLKPQAGGLRMYDANTVNGAILMASGVGGETYPRALFAGSQVDCDGEGSTVPDCYAAVFNGASSLLESGLRAKFTGNPGSAGWSDGVCIGGAGNESGGFCWGGDWYHLIAFAAAHTLEERNLMRAYFARQFNGKTLLRFTGDSLTQGSGATAGVDDYPKQCFDLLGGSSQYEYTNAGSGGTTAAAWGGTAGASMKSNAGQYSSALRKSVCIHWAGTNDLLAGTSAASVYTILKDSWAVIRASGMRVVTVTTIARENFDAGQETARQDLNALILSDPSLYDACADVAALPQFDELADASNTTYYSDGVHLTPTGYGLIAESVADAITEALSAANVSLST